MTRSAHKHPDNVKRRQASTEIYGSDGLWGVFWRWRRSLTGRGSAAHYTIRVLDKIDVWSDTFLVWWSQVQVMLDFWSKRARWDIGLQEPFNGDGCLDLEASTKDLNMIQVPVREQDGYDMRTFSCLNKYRMLWVFWIACSGLRHW